MAKNKIEIQERSLPAVESEEMLLRLASQARDAAGERIPSAIARKVVQFESALRDIEDAFEQFKGAVNKLKTEVLPQIFEDHDTTSITVMGYRVTASAQIRATIRQGLRADAVKWLEQNGLQDIIDYEPSVNPSTLAATVRTQMEEGVQFPDEVFNVYTFNNTSLTKAK